MYTVQCTVKLYTVHGVVFNSTQLIEQFSAQLNCTQFSAQLSAQLNLTQFVLQFIAIMYSEVWLNAGRLNAMWYSAFSITKHYDIEI